MLNRSLITVSVILASAFAGPLHAATAEDAFAEAQRLEKAASDQQAVAAYELFITKYPDHSLATEAHYRAAKCLDNLGLVEQAVEKLKIVAKADPKSYKNYADALYLLGKQYAALKDYKSAAEIYEKLLAKGAGLNEDEVLNLCAGWYAILGKYDDAAAKFNILKRKTGTPLAESAAYKIVLLWLKADKLDNALIAIQDLAETFPKSERLPEVLLKTADAYRKAGKAEKCAALCQQIKDNYPKKPEGLAASYLLGVLKREAKDFKEAVAIFEQVGKTVSPATRLIAADALAQAAEIYRSDLNDLPKAISKYEEASTIARDTEGERRNEILEQCYFQLGEYYFAQKKYSTAVEYYLQLRNLGTKINILGRIMACQAELKQDNTTASYSEADIEAIRKKIADNPNTQIAAEAEVFILDRKLSEALRGRGTAATLSADYEKLATKYSAEILKKDGLDAYIQTQAGIAYSQGATRDDYTKGVAAFEKAIALSKDSPATRITCLQNIAQLAERFGDKARARQAYSELYALAKSNSDAKPDDKAALAQTTDYLKAILTRADGKDGVETAIATAQKVIDEKGPLSDLGRNAQFYIAELYFLKKDYSKSAASYRDFIIAYGPKQDAQGDIVSAPWKPAKMDDTTNQIYEASARIAHCWLLQGHDQNMVKAYQWLVKNVPNANPYVPEANYWLALEIGKGKKAESKEAKREMAKALWLTVVHPSLDFGSKNFSKNYLPWVNNTDRYAAAQDYVKSAILKSGQHFSESDDHESAFAVFQAYLDLYPARKPSGNNRRDERNPEPRDDMYSIARYALGREAIALNSPTRLVEAYKPYITGFRDDRFRVSGLKLLGFYAGKANMLETAVEAYATLLDEYGPNRLDKNNNPIRLPDSERLRPNAKGWDGIRQAPPKDLNLGEIHYALGYLYWKREDYALCLIALRPFLADPALKSNSFREKALFMAAQSAFKIGDSGSATPLILALLRDHPNFEAIEEAHVFAMRGLVDTKAWDDLELTYRNFIKSWPRSDRRPRVDYYEALGLAAQGKSDKATPMLNALATGENYQDIKADACYQLGLIALKSNNFNEAAKQLEKSVSLHPREQSCLEAAKVFVKLNQPDKARTYLNQIDRDFKDGDRRTVDEAKAVAADLDKSQRKSK